MRPPKEVYRGRIVRLQLEEVVLPSGATMTLEIVKHPGAAAVVALDEHDEVTLVRQLRHAAGGFIWEIPAGTLNDSEDPAACAVRELREETGLAAADVVPLGTILTTPGFCDERIHLFLARRLTAADQSLDDDEVLSVSRFPLERVLEMVRAGEIQDAKSIAGLHLAAAFLAKGSGGAPRD